MNEDLKPAVGIFCCGIILGCCIGLCIGLVTSNIMDRPCNHRASLYDVTFARTSTGTLVWFSNGPDYFRHRTYQPTDTGYIKASQVFEPYMAYATSLSHDRGRQVIFCEKCWPYAEALGEHYWPLGEGQK